MSQGDCGSIRVSIPAFAANRLEPEESLRVDRHLTTCVGCREELELAQLLLSNRPQAPAGLADRIVQAVHDDRRVARRPWWGLSAAAVAALALGIGIVSDRAVTPVVPDYAYELEEGEVWLSDDGLLAGAPAVEELSDEALSELLDELAMLDGGAA